MSLFYFLYICENMEKRNIIYDCDRGCTTERTEHGELICNYHPGCCKLKDSDWLKGTKDNKYDNLYEVRFKNTRKNFYENTSGQLLEVGDLVVVEAVSGHDLGIITLHGPIVGRQIRNSNIPFENREFKKIYRKAKPLDLERWQEAIAKENDTMIKARKIATDMGLNMKIGDVEYQGDGGKAIFYYIADERVDFRQLIKVFAEEFKIRIEMKQIGARQEAGLIGGIGVCGRELCCSKYITNFQSISTQAARSQDLSLNPLKLAGQCGKLKCCINYESSVYTDALKRFPVLSGPLELEEGQAVHVKNDILKGIMWFSYTENNISSVVPLTIEEVKKIMEANKKGIKPASLTKEKENDDKKEFITYASEDNIDRFDDKKKKRKKKKSHHNGPNKDKEKEKENKTN